LKSRPGRGKPVFRRGGGGKNALNVSNKGNQKKGTRRESCPTTAKAPGNGVAPTFQKIMGGGVSRKESIDVQIGGC